MSGYGFQLGIVLMLSSAAFAVLVVWLQRHHWRLTIRMNLCVTAYVALVCFWVQRDVRAVLPYVMGEYFFYFAIGLFQLLFWPFLLSWIIASSIAGPTAKKKLRPRPKGVEFTRHAPKSSSTPWSSNWFVVVVVYCVIQRIWALGVFSFGPLVTSLWSEVNEIGVSLRAMDHAVNGMFIVYVLVTLWTEFTEQNDSTAARFVPYGIAILLLTAQHLAIPPF